jgi:aspartate carbamoyltransferase catalytic subunit
VGTENAEQFSSAAKGETLEHSIRVLAEYHPAIIVLRHKEKGAAERAAAVSSVPIFNGGDGNGEHPTQAVLDAYTIFKEFRTLSGLSVVMGGDLARGRTARSLVKVLSQYPDNHLTFTSTPELAMGDDIKMLLTDRGVSYVETEDPEEAFTEANVVYWTRLQKERALDKIGPDGQPVMVTEQDPRFILGQVALDILPRDSMIMHQMPIDGEIDPVVDEDPRARYFKQAGYGIPTRIALIDRALRDVA